MRVVVIWLLSFMPILYGLFRTVSREKNDNFLLDFVRVIPYHWPV
jgi:hypothetical protein